MKYRDKKLPAPTVNHLQFTCMISNALLCLHALNFQLIEASKNQNNWNIPQQMAWFMSWCFLKTKKETFFFQQ